jgi:hypothetical protein
MVTEINFDRLEVGLGFRMAIELILVAIQWLVLLTSWPSNGDLIVANCWRLRPKSTPSGWPRTIETNSASHLCRFKWWVHYKNHTWVIVSISLSNVWIFCLPIVIGVAYVEKKGTILEDGEVHDATCETNSNLIFKMKEPHYSSRNIF